MSADVTASVANDAARLPAGSAVIVDDFHFAATAAGPAMTDLVERWPAEIVQLVLAGRYDPPLRQHRLRMSGQLCEIRDRDLYFSLAESHDLLANFGVQLADAHLALLHRQSEGWPAVMQMAALSLRGTTDPARLARVLEFRGQAIADYFVSEVFGQQPPELAQFMLDTSILVGVLTADACAVVAGWQDAAALLRAIDSAHLFLVALDDERTRFRYHRLVRNVLRAELCPRDLRVPAVPEPLVLSMADPSMLAETPERLLGLAAHLLLSGDTARGGEYLDLLEQTGRIPPGSELAARLAAFQSFRYGVAGQLETAVQKALAARAAQDLTHLTDEWNVAVPLILARMYTCLGDFPAAEREAAAALAAPDVAESVKLVMVPGTRALALFEAGYLAQAADLAGAADADAQRLDSAGISSPSTICARCPASRWNAATSTPRSISPNECYR
jgi:LuxR family transcriptional regulator, maltose regulon positive regulatory protein